MRPPVSQNLFDLNVPALVGVACFLALVTILGAWFYRRYLGVSREGGYLLAVGTVVAAIVTVVYKMNQLDRPVYYPRHEGAMRAVWAGFFVLTGVPLAVKLYRSWIGGHVMEEEKAMGAAGVRAWLTPANLALATAASICAAQGFGYSFWGVLALGLLALLAYPGITMLSQSGPPALPVESTDNLTAEREKVLSLLEAGRITAEESAELLNALGSTLRRPEPKGVAFAPEHRTMLIGAALVLIGFFLPWFTIDIGKEMQRVAGQVQGEMNQFAQQMPGASGFSGQMNIPNGNGAFGNFQMGVINVTGGEVHHGLGWLVMVLSLGTALLPVVATHLDAQTRRMVSMLALGAGALIVVYLLTNSLRFLNVGIVLVSAGYVAQWACVLKRGGAPHVVPSGVGEPRVGIW